MRKLTEDIARAFVNGQKKTVSNTSTDGMSVWLHGHEIIRKTGNKEFKISLCGWGTPTTRERLNGILSFAGYDVRFFQQNHEQFIQSGHFSPLHVDVFDLWKVKSNGQIGQMYKDWHR